MMGKERPRQLTSEGWAEAEGPAGKTEAVWPGALWIGWGQCLEKGELELRGSGAHGAGVGGAENLSLPRAQQMHRHTDTLPHGCG